jgi:hypothetical protein
MLTLIQSVNYCNRTKTKTLPASQCHQVHRFVWIGSMLLLACSPNSLCFILKILVNINVVESIVSMRIELYFPTDLCSAIMFL